MTPSPFPQMPMGQVAAAATGAPTGFPAMPPPTGGAVAPSAQAAPVMGQQMPAPGAGVPPGVSVRLQANGTSVYTTTGLNGAEIILGLNPPVKLPKAMQPQAPQAPGAQ